MNSSNRTVTASHTALRAEPGHAAEQVSQLRLGDPFVAERSEGDWFHGAGPDGYSGWVRSWHLGEAPERSADRVVTARSSRGAATPGGETLTDLSFATRLPSAGAAEGDWLPWTLPDGRIAWSPLADLSPLPDVPLLETALLLERGLRLLEIPYEWGGGSSWGLDCSGLVQLLFATLGHWLPRDSDQQAAWGKPGDPGGIRPGDLLFYGEPRINHVGLALGDETVLHARGRVRIDRLDPAGGLGKMSLRAIRRGE